MNNEKLCCGIDVSQKSLDVAYQNNLGEIFHIKVGNNNKGFEIILAHTGTSYHVVRSCPQTSFLLKSPSIEAIVFFAAANLICLFFSKFASIFFKVGLL